ncbi:MAG: hypothetical protein JWO98_3346 [Frankiales bacterium]|nr:hypothetical protein [Frankiales bacterium]
MAAIPDGMPILSRGKHKNPARGACFMEYTALLAGEPFTDAPRCVDRELAAVLRHANDTLSDADRPRLLPLLGRAIGLAVRPPVPGPGEPGDELVARHARATVRLHRLVSARFMAAIGHVATQDEMRLHDDGRDVDDLFWYLMLEPTVLSTSADYIGRLIARLYLLHECYEGTMRDLGMQGVDVAVREQDAVFADVFRAAVPAR